MPAIPLPFVIALLLAILAAVLLLRREKENGPAVLFLVLCVLVMTTVGLRWTFDSAIFRFLLPVLLSTIPVTAWYCFARAHHSVKRVWKHAVGPGVILIGSLIQPLWHLPLDPLLTLLDIIYGSALIYSSLKSSDIPEQIRLSDIEWARKAEQVAGFVLLFSACIDGGLAFDFAFYGGRHAVIILTIGHLFLLPTLAVAVVVVSMSIRPSETLPGDADTSLPMAEEPARSMLDASDADRIAKQLDELLRTQEIFLDPDLTLNRLARKAGIPSRQISAAVNQVYGRNLSQVINQYRIERAKHLLATTEEPITQIYLNSGFQTKSNFNREFSRITGQAPSAYRLSRREKAILSSQE